MLFKNIIVIDEDMNVKHNRYVGIKGEKIDYVGDSFPENASGYGRTYDGSNRLLMSGFYNAHAHSPMALMRGYGENMALRDWLEKKIFPFEAKLTGNDVYRGTMLCIFFPAIFWASSMLSAF